MQAAASKVFVGKDSWSVRNGLLAAEGPRSISSMSVPYAGRFPKLRVANRTSHSAGMQLWREFPYALSGNRLPKKGFAVQINNTARGEGNYRERPVRTRGSARVVLCRALPSALFGSL